MKNTKHSKLDKLIIKFLGEPSEMRELPPEQTTNEAIQSFIDYIENNKKSLIIIFIIIGVLKIIEKNL